MFYGTKQDRLEIMEESVSELVQELVEQLNDNITDIEALADDNRLHPAQFFSQYFDQLSDSIEKTKKWAKDNYGTEV